VARRSTLPLLPFHNRWLTGVAAASTMSALPEPLRRVLRHDTSPPWFDRSYLLDW
jgi:hypothetical protein